MIDNYLQELIKEETDKLNNTICLIASEGLPDQDILDLEGSVMSVHYSEGLPGNRHYAGCEVIDKVEQYCIDKACELFRVKHANVQTFNGSNANTCVYHAFCKPGDRTLSGNLSQLAHLTHGSKFTYSGRIYENHNYELVNELIDYNEIRKRLYEVKPRLLIMGYSAYSRRIDFEKVREIVDEYNTKLKEEYENNAKSSEGGYDATIDWYIKEYEQKKCILWTDMAHFSLFVAAHLWKDKYDPTIWSDVVTTTTHKGLLGPRSSVILWNNDEYTKKINSAVFPGNIGGSNQAMTAAKAQCFINCLKPEFKEYAEQVYRNMQAIINGIKDFDKENKIRFVSGGSENHMVLLDMKGIGLTGKQAESLLELYNIICNKNMISGDLKPADCTGIRIGTPAITTRGFDEDMCFELGRVIAHILLRGKQEVPEGTIDIEDASIHSTIKKMLDRVGPFYKQKYDLSKDDGPDDIIA